MLDNEAKIWGEVYEIGAKRGAIMALLDAKLLPTNHPLVLRWNRKQLMEVLAEVKAELYSEVVNATIHENIEKYFQHLMKCSFGHGYTNTREFLRKIKPKGSPLAKSQNAKPNWGLTGIWCPLTMPNDITQIYLDDFTTAEEYATMERFKAETTQTFKDQFKIYQADMFMACPHLALHQINMQAI